MVQRSTLLHLTTICYLADRDAKGHDGTIEPNMVLCVESCFGAEGGWQGVKLEEQVPITETGCETLSKFPSRTTSSRDVAARPGLSAAIGYMLASHATPRGGGDG